MIAEINHRWSRCIIATGETVRAAAEASRANLRGADLRGAYLCGADLHGADLRGAYLCGANLCGAYLSGAYLCGANLCGAYLSGTNLSGADISDADISDANLGRANLCQANLSGANLIGAYLSGAKLSGASGFAEIPIVSNIDAAILVEINGHPDRLDQSAYHRCETTHCRAGWAIVLAGEAGRKLEIAIGSSAAGALIYAVSRPGKPLPDFYASNEEAMADLQACATK